MRHELNRVPQFYVTAPQKCPYIKGKIERKLFTALYGRNTVNLNDELSLQGFRRSQKVLYRPLCSNCSACLSIRVKVNEFYYSKSQKRVINKNEKLIRVKKKPEATDDEVFAAADLAMCKEFIDNLDEGYHTMIGENRVKLSGGEKQRLSIARAFLKKSKIILLDEATASLDSETEDKIQKALNELTNNKTTISTNKITNPPS